MALGCLFLERKGKVHFATEDNLWASTSVPDIHTQEGKTETKQMQTRAIRMTGKEKSLAYSSYQTNAERGLGCSPQIWLKDEGG